MRFSITILAPLCLGAQTSIYVQSSGPASQTVVGATNATPIVITTNSAHGFPTSCNTNTNVCYCTGVGVSTGAGASPVSGVKECVPTDSTHLAIYQGPNDSSPGSPTVGNGGWWNDATVFPNINQSGQWIAPLTQYAIPARPGPLGYFDGNNGDLTRRLALTPRNGLVSLVVSGGTLTVTTSYNPIAGTNRFPIAVGNGFSIHGTRTTLDTCGGGVADCVYTMATVSSTGWTATGTWTGVTTGDYTNINNHCGPTATPSDTIGGALSCTTISQIGQSNNPWWNQLVSNMAQNGWNSGVSYRTIYDGGAVFPAHDIHAMYAGAAVRFMVDPSNSQWLNIIIYSLNHDYRTSGVGYTINSAWWGGGGQSNSDYNYANDFYGLAMEYAVVTRSAPTSYWMPSEQATFLNRTFNDVDDPSVTPASIVNQDAGITSTHNWVLSSGNNLVSATNDATHATLNSSGGCVLGSTLQLANGNSNAYNGYTYGHVTSCSGATATVSGGWTGADITPKLNNVVGGSYSSGLTCTGTTGQLVTLNLSGGGGSYASATVTLTGTNTIANGTPLTIVMPGSGYTSGPTSGSPVGYASYAACTGTAAISTTIGTPYSVFDTLTLSSTAAGATATATWGTTVLGSSLSVGDAVAAYDGWSAISGSVASAQSYVTQVGPCGGGACTGGCSSLTSKQACVINNNGVTASSSIPRMAWRFPQWSGTDAGRLWASKHEGSSYGVSSALYGSGVNNNISNNYIADTASNGGGSCPACVLGFDLSTVLDDTRAQRDLTRTQTYLFNYGLRSDMDTITGMGRFGTGYSKDTQTPVDELTVWPLTQTIPSYPHLHIDTGPWGQNPPLWWIFSTLPDNQGNSYNFMAEHIYGYQEYSYDNVGAVSIGTAFMPAFWWQPTSNNAKWLLYWLNHAPSQSTGGWGRTENYMQALAVLHDDPRITPSVSLPMPTQFGSFPNSSSTMTADTGWPSIYNGGNAVISRGTDWGSDGSLVLFDSSTNTSGNAYDSPRVGELCIWYDGPLLCTDSNASGNAYGDPSTIGDTFQFNGAGGSGFVSGLAPSGVGPTPITAWASANAGAYGTQFGDQASRYAYACTSTVANYNQAVLSLAIDHGVECFAHYKAPGHDEFIFKFHDYALTSGTAAMAWHLQYPQNGQTQSGGNDNPTGSTTLSGGAITSLESSGHGTHGLQTAVMSPNTITLKDDCVGLASGQCSPSATYPGGAGYTHRFTVAGGGSVGAAVSKFQTVTCHKIMASPTDTTFTSTALNPDANWTGAQCGGAKSTSVYVQSLASATHSTMTSFTVASSLPVDWIIGGLTPGNYTLIVGGTQIFAGAVDAGDGTIYARSSKGGTVVLSNSLSSPLTDTPLSNNIILARQGVIH